MAKKEPQEPIHYAIDYDGLHAHIGHKIVVNDIWDWATNRETGLEIRCADCEGEEPLLEMDLPREEEEE